MQRTSCAKLELLNLQSVLIGDVITVVNVSILLTDSCKLVLVGICDALHDKYCICHIYLIIAV